MPHIILETTSDLQENGAVPDILEGLVQKLGTFETIDTRSIKARHHLRPVWHMGEGAPSGFAHVQVRILSGRSIELRRRIASGMFDQLKGHLQESIAAKEVSVSFELVEMNSETYHKN